MWTVTGWAQGTDSIADKFLSFLESAAILLGQGLVQLLNFILPAGKELGPDFVAPLGYLGLLTVLLLLFSILEAARKVIWFLVALGWVLMVVRIVLVVLGVS